MKKNGYTLAEVMITLGIIGVLAAIMLPMANKLRPDSTKAAYLNNYDALVTAINGVVNNEDIYPTVANGINFSKTPLLNTAAAEVDGTQIDAGANKLCNVLRETLRTEANNADFNINNACSITRVSDNLNATTDFSRDFTAKNGTQIMVRRPISRNNNRLYYRTDIYMDINGAEGNNCIYDADSCPNPDRFKFFVSANGQILPADPMGRYYLETRTNMKAQKDVEIDDSAVTFPENLQVADRLTLGDMLAQGIITYDKIDTSKLTDMTLHTDITDFISSGDIKFDDKTQKYQLSDTVLNHFKDLSTMDTPIIKQSF